MIETVKSKKMKREEYIGQKFNMLTVLGIDHVEDNEPRGCAISECTRYKPGKIKWSLSLEGIRYDDDDV